MARSKEKAVAIALRQKGMSYSQIKEKLGISKSTLSGWLQSMLLSEKRIRELRDNNERRIERSRETKRLKKQERRAAVYQKVKLDIEQNKDTAFVAGFYLYWGEGTKTAEYSVALTNSDPAIINYFVTWLGMLTIDKSKLKVKLHLYSDQEESALIKFWSGVTGIPKTNFYKTYWKTSRSDKKTYKGMFAHGTCAVVYHDRDLYEYVLQGVAYLRDRYRCPSGRT